jgi:hypothetical protein
MLSPDNLLAPRRPDLRLDWGFFSTKDGTNYPPVSATALWAHVLNPSASQSRYVVPTRVRWLWLAYLAGVTAGVPAFTVELRGADDTVTLATMPIPAASSYVAKELAVDRPAGDVVTVRVVQSAGGVVNCYSGIYLFGSSSP